MLPLEQAVTRAVQETRRALEILRSKGREFPVPLLVPQVALGLEFSGVAPVMLEGGHTHVDTQFGEISVGRTDGQGKTAAIGLIQIHNVRPVTFAPVPNLQSRRDISTRGIAAVLEIGGPYNYVPGGSIALTWRQDDLAYRVQASGLPEDQVLHFAEVLTPLL